MALLAGATLFSVRLSGPPSALASDASPAEFSAGRAFQDVTAMARSPHPMGSAAHGEVRNYLLARFRALGLEPQVQTAVVTSPGGQHVGRIRNVMARLRGRKGPEAIALVAHYDSRDGSPGASDDGAGVATLLETLRALRAGPPLEHDVILLITDGEEAGLLGAKGFVSSHPWAKDVRLVINLEARGTRGAVQMFQTGKSNLALIRAFGEAVPAPCATSLASTLYEWLPNDTDFSVFLKAKMVGYNFAFIEAPWNYHTPLDNPAQQDPRSLQQMGDACLALTRHWGSRDLAVRAPSSAVYFNPLGHTFLSVPADWALPVALLLLGLLLVGGVLAVRRGRLRPWASLAGLAMPLLGIPLALGVAAGASFGLSQAHRALLNSREDTFFYNDGYGVALLCLGLLTQWILFRVCSARLGWRNLAFGATFLLCLLGLALSVVLPGLSHLFLWPALFAVPGVLLSLGEESTWKLWVVGMLATLPFLLMASPLLGTLAQTMGMELPVFAGFAFFGGLFFWVAIPAVEGLHRLESRALPAGLIVCVLLGILAARQTTLFSIPTVQFSNIRYCMDLSGGHAFWVTHESMKSEWTRPFLLNPERGLPFQVDPRDSGGWIHSHAPMVPWPKARLEVEEDGESGGFRHLRVRIVPLRPLEDFRLLGTGPLPSLARIDGVQARPRRLDDGKTWYLGLLAPGDEGFLVELTFPAKAGLPGLDLVEMAQGLPDVPGWTPRPMPPGILPVGFGNSTWVRWHLPVPSASSASPALPEK